MWRDRPDILVGEEKDRASASEYWRSELQSFRAFFQKHMFRVVEKKKSVTCRLNPHWSMPTTPTASAPTLLRSQWSYIQDNENQVYSGSLAGLRVNLRPMMKSFLYPKIILPGLLKFSQKLPCVHWHLQIFFRNLPRSCSSKFRFVCFVVPFVDRDLLVRLPISNPFFDIGRTVRTFDGIIQRWQGLELFLARAYASFP